MKGSRTIVKGKRTRLTRTAMRRNVIAVGDDEVNWVRENFDRLVKTHGRRYVAVEEHKVVDVDDSWPRLSERLQSRYGNVSFQIVHLDEDELFGGPTLDNMIEEM